MVPTNSILLFIFIAKILYDYVYTSEGQFVINGTKSLKYSIILLKIKIMILLYNPAVFYHNKFYTKEEGILIMIESILQFKKNLEYLSSLFVDLFKYLIESSLICQNRNIIFTFNENYLR